MLLILQPLESIPSKYYYDLIYSINFLLTSVDIILWTQISIIAAHVSLPDQTQTSLDSDAVNDLIELIKFQIKSLLETFLIFTLIMNVSKIWSTLKQNPSTTNETKRKYFSLKFSVRYNIIRKFHHQLNIDLDSE